MIQGWIDTSAYDVRGDLDLDGDVDTADKSSAQGGTQTLGRSVLSGVRNRLGLAGYWSGVIDGSVSHARMRVLSSAAGRWLSRDPIEGASENAYGYTSGRPVTYSDTTGELAVLLCVGCVVSETFTSTDDKSIPIGCLDGAAVKRWRVNKQSGTCVPEAGHCKATSCSFDYDIEYQGAPGSKCYYELKLPSGTSGSKKNKIHKRSKIDQQTRKPIPEKVPCGSSFTIELKVNGKLAISQTIECSKCKPVGTDAGPSGGGTGASSGPDRGSASEE